MADTATAGAIPLDPEAAAASRRRLVTRVVIYGLLTVFALVYIVPLIVVVMNSFRDQVEIANNGLIAIPQSFKLDAWWQAWDTYCIAGTCQGMKRNFFNSLWMTIRQRSSRRCSVRSTAMCSASGASPVRKPSSPWCCWASSCPARSR
jgi:glucose/mannose transport system permease protein